ncbi:MAG: hypothetical protein H6642_14505 [Caldilineaceae bacterium]|nr:hypothetical protein [Caldilineaceae bacterium]
MSGQYPDQSIHFRETQPMNRVAWVMFFVIAICALMWYTLIVQVFLGRPVGTNPSPDWMVWLFWLIFGILFPLAFYYMRLEVIVDPAAVRINFRPILTRVIPLSDIVAAEPRTYDPLREYGGWGIRGVMGKKKAYTTTGREGVELTLRSGERLMIGSQHPGILAEAINKLR